MASDQALLVLLTGGPGAGKSEALSRLHDELGADGTASAAIDVDEIMRSYPPTDDTRGRAHLSALCESFRQAGHGVLLVAVTAEGDEDLRAWIDATGSGRSLVVHLLAGVDTVEDRVRRRERAGWFGLADLVDSARRLSTLRFADADVELATDSLSPDQVAASLMPIVRSRLER